MEKRKHAAAIITAAFAIIFSYMIDNYANAFAEAIKSPLLDGILKVITNFGILFLVMLLIPAVFIYKKNQKLAYLLFGSFLVSVAASLVIKAIFLRQRPIDIISYPNFLSYSFPSMHTMVAFSLLPFLFRIFPKQKHFWITFAVLVAVSRFYFGFHFLSDVVFGAFAGYFIGYIMMELTNKHGKTRN